MLNPFLEKYAAYSTLELLQIVGQEKDYQPDAVSAARELLNARNEEEKEAAAQELMKQQDAAANTIAERKQQVEVVKGFFEPLVSPKGKVDRVWWVYFFSLLLSAKYLYSLYDTISHFAFVSRCNTCSWGGYELFLIAVLTYMPIYIYLVFKRVPWGWILMVLESALIIFLSVPNIKAYITYSQSRYGIANSAFEQLFKADATTVFVTPLIYLLFAVFLQSKEMRELYNISDSIRKRTMQAVVGIFVACAGLWFLKELID